MDLECPLHNSRWALNKAIENVEKHFPVVGVLEEMDLSLRLMQTALPKYFGGIWDKFEHNTRKYINIIQSNKTFSATICRTL